MRGKTTILLIGLLLIAGGIYLMMQKNVFNLPSGNESNNTGNAGGTPQAHDITIQGFAFSPSALTISAGDTVKWTNLDSASHTITSDSGSELASPSFGNGQTYSHTFNTTGTFSYHCSIHSTMKGKIIVE